MCGSLPSSLSMRAAMAMALLFRRLQGTGEPRDALECPSEVLLGSREREPDPPRIAKGVARHDRDAFLGHETLAELGGGRGRAGEEAVDPEEKVERTERINELDAGKVAAEMGHHQVPPVPELLYHAHHVILHPGIAERGGGGPLGGLGGPAGDVRL